VATIDEINNKIIQDAEAEAKERLEKATERAGKIIEMARQEAVRIKKEIMEKSEKEAAEYIRRAKVLAGIEVRKEKLELRQKLLQEALQKTLEKLASMPEEDYCSMIAGAVMKLREDEEYEILLAENDRLRIGSKLEEILAKTAEETGKRINVRISDSNANISGGFIIRTEDIELNYSFENIMSAEKEELEKIFWATGEI